MKKPLVSILTTCYNREKYLAECIESVTNSTFQDWEMIIVDDQSQDKSVRIAKTYASKDKRISVYVNDKNVGDYPNRNRAASYAKGKYLKYLDADDMLYKNTLEIMVENMEQFSEAALGFLIKMLMTQKRFRNIEKNTNISIKPIICSPHKTKQIVRL